MKLIMIMTLLILSLMTVVGAFLVNSVMDFYLKDFYTQMATVFADRSLSADLQLETEDETNKAEMIAQVLTVYSGTLGIDGQNRNFYVLDGTSGAFLVGSDPDGGSNLAYTDNLLVALQKKEVGDQSSMAADYMDLAIPITRGGDDFVIYILDQKVTVSLLVNEIISLILEALIFALFLSLFLSFLLSKTMVTPLEQLTQGAKQLARGNFSNTIQVSSHDEIGVLTEAFNAMANQLEDTLDQVEEERDKLNTLFLHMNDGVLAFSQKGTIIHANPSAKEMLVQSIELDVTTYESLLDEITPFEALLAVDDYFEGEMERYGRHLELLMAPLDRNRHGGVLVVIRDVTAQRQNENLRREFVANVSHELRTPITNIKSYAETLEDNSADIDSETRQKFLGVIVKESDRMTHIVQDLLTLSRFDSHRADLTLRKFSFEQAVQELYNAVYMESVRHEHTLKLDIKGKLPHIIADRERILQVMMNITSNAIKYTPNGGEIIISAGKTEDNQSVYMIVDDNGIGIPEEDRSRIFERFYRVDKARSRHSGGTGLGLAIAEEIVERHGGQLRLLEKEGSGAKIMLELLIEGGSVS